MLKKWHCNKWPNTLIIICKGEGFHWLWNTPGVYKQAKPPPTVHYCTLLYHVDTGQANGSAHEPSQHEHCRVVQESDEIEIEAIKEEVDKEDKEENQASPILLSTGVKVHAAEENTVRCPCGVNEVSEVRMYPVNSCTTCVVKCYMYSVVYVDITTTISTLDEH